MDFTDDNYDDQPLLVAVILCGGTGSRLWPLSRASHPKPFLTLSDGQSLLQKSFLRVHQLSAVNKVLTVSNQEFLFKIQDEITALNIKNFHNSLILEPEPHNTAAAIAVASLQIAKIYGDQTNVLVLTADHLINDFVAFQQAVAQSIILAQQNKIVVFGVKPEYPATGYGYILAAHNIVKSFVEKPSMEQACKYIQNENFLWNSGMLCFNAATMLQEMQNHCAEILLPVKQSWQTATVKQNKDYFILNLKREDFAKVPSQSIDYALLEKTQRAAVVACDIGWSDIGCWQSFAQTLPSDDNENHIHGDVLSHHTKNCTIFSEKRLITAVGIHDITIIDTEDALLVAHKSCSQQIKDIYLQLQQQRHESHKTHRLVQRPWGSYTVLEEGNNFKIKRIEVKVGAQLSLQMHNYRSENWIVVQGIAEVINGKDKFELKINQSTYIPAKNKHRLTNISDDILIVIEVQSGEYLGEDDIVRFEDVYGRETCVN